MSCLKSCDERLDCVLRSAPKEARFALRFYRAFYRLIHSSQTSVPLDAATFASSRRVCRLPEHVGRTWFERSRSWVGWRALSVTAARARRRDKILPGRFVRLALNSIFGFSSSLRPGGGGFVMSAVTISALLVVVRSAVSSHSSTTHRRQSGTTHRRPYLYRLQPAVLLHRHSGRIFRFDFARSETPPSRDRRGNRGWLAANDA